MVTYMKKSVRQWCIKHFCLPMMYLMNTGILNRLLNGMFQFKGVKIALTICEDIWNLGDNPLYRVCPMDHLMQQQPQLMINISASPFDYDHDEDRREVIRQNVKKYTSAHGVLQCCGFTNRSCF